ncbi:MAG: Ig-like domain-containing protein [Candidatus Shapirobacteria bacterium]
MKKSIFAGLMAILLLGFIASCAAPVPGDITAPAVNSTVPANAAVNVAIDGNLTAIFSEAMKTETISTTTFTLEGPGTTVVSGVVSLSEDGLTAIFNPAANLVGNTGFTATITTGAQDLAGNALESNYAWTFTTAAIPDTTAPVVSSTVPANLAVAVALNGNLTASFNEAMKSSTISDTTFTLAGPGTTVVPGVVSLSVDGLIATFNPAADLAASTLFTATITTGAQDLAGNALASSHAWTFTTGAVPDTTAATVLSTVPAANATDVAIASYITATFSEAMTTGTISGTSFFLAGPGSTAVAGAVSYTGTTATLNPNVDLAYNTLYTATLTTAVTDLAGNPLAANKIWTFTTGVAPDTTAPTVISTVPAASATDIAIANDVTATFSEAMTTGTISGTSFILAGPGTTAVAGSVSYTGTTATFNPAANLAYSTLYTATLTTAVTDMAGNPLAAAKVWTFTTAAEVVTPPLIAAVELGTAGDYVILAKAGITTTGTTAIIGNIAVSPIGSAAMTGFGFVADASATFSTSSLITGRAYAADYTEPTPTNLTTAIAAMETAYTDAAGRTLPNYTELAAGDISGLTLAPGLYTWSSAVLINTNVTLSGNATDVWIFQIAGDLTMAASTSVVLSGGALPKNIFWQVAGDTGVTIGASSSFNGVVLARTAISLLSGATVNGRLLSQTAVTLIGNAVTQPSP